jgi:signal transduction histidine kinase
MVESVHDNRARADVAMVASLRIQRAVTERLLLAALREHDRTTRALEASGRAAFLASVSRDLAASLDQGATREAVQRRTLLRDGSWCIVDVVELDGTIRRLTVVHPDPDKQARAQEFADRWFPASAAAAAGGEVTLATDATLSDLQALRDLGFGGLLVVPLVVRSRVLGAITFVTPDGAARLSPNEMALATDVADLCALALDNARLYHDADALRAAADAVSRAKSAFFGNMSHELMTPLNAIGGYTTILEMGLHGPVTSEQLRDLARIRNNQQHLLTMISKVLDFVQNESGRVEMRLTDVSVASVLGEVAGMLAGMAEERSLRLVAEPVDPAVMVRADQDRVRQILVNLVMNAIKYAAVDGGVITLGCTAADALIRIHVTDTGPGIPADQLTAIFEPFRQLASGAASRRGGVGLGLAISRDLARAMSGELTAESTVGVGSRFTLQLSRTASEPPADGAAPAPPFHSHQG